jgi:hypothetical protein
LALLLNHISYPSTISVGLFIKGIGSVENNQFSKTSTVGGFTHVFVDRINHRPNKISDK